MLMDYYKVFGTKNCVFDDLRMYLDTFRMEDVNEVCVCGVCVCDMCVSCVWCVCGGYMCMSA